MSRKILKNLGRSYSAQVCHVNLRRVGAIARVISIALATAGVILLVEVATTLVWQEPMSALYASAQQGDAEAGLESATEEFERQNPQEEVPEPSEQSDEADTAEEAERAERRAAREQAAQLERHATEMAEAAVVGAPLGRITADRMGLDLIFFFGTDTATLRKGPGLYPERSFPGQGGTTAIAGHRTTYGSPFENIDRLREGDEVTLNMPYGTFTYSVTGTEIVLPSDVHVVDQVDYQRLVMTACHPLYSAAQRIVVTAELSEAIPK